MNSTKRYIDHAYATGSPLHIYAYTLFSPSTYILLGFILLCINSKSDEFCLSIVYWWFSR